MKLFVAALDLCLRGVAPLAETAVCRRNVNAAPPQKAPAMIFYFFGHIYLLSMDGLALNCNRTELADMIPMRVSTSPGFESLSLPNTP